MSILSNRPDGLNFYYGFAKPDMRRIDVCPSTRPPGGWIAYVAGQDIGIYPSKDAAEKMAILYIKDHPADAEG